MFRSSIMLLATMLCVSRIALAYPGQQLLLIDALILDGTCGAMEPGRTSMMGVDTENQTSLFSPRYSGIHGARLRQGRAMRTANVPVSPRMQTGNPFPGNRT